MKDYRGFTLPHPTPPRNPTMLEYSICVPIFSSFIVAEAWWRGKYRVIAGHLTLTYILYQIPHIQSAIFTFHFNLNSTPSTIKKVCRAKPCWSITLFWVPCYLFLGGIWWRIWITKTKNRRSLFIVIVMQRLSWLFHQLCQPRKCKNYMDKETKTKCSYSIYILRTEDDFSYCYIDNDTYFVNCRLYCLLVLSF